MVALGHSDSFIPPSILQIHQSILKSEILLVAVMVGLGVGVNYLQQMIMIYISVFLKLLRNCLKILFFKKLLKKLLNEF